MRKPTLLCAFGCLWPALCVLTSCYPVKQYQSNMVGQFPIIPGQPKSIPLAFIEFDDSGEIFSRAQLNNTVQQISTLRTACPDSFTTVLFIHGWKNNADNHSNNVAGFEQFLRDVYADVTRAETPGRNCTDPLMGIYIGWRGARIRIGENFTYWNGSDAAVRAGGPDLEEALYQIMRAVRPEVSAKSNLILIGHSFGGRVLEKVMTPYLETLILRDDRHETSSACVTGQASGPVLRGQLPTLTVLLNEAAPATDAKQFLDFLKCHDVQYRMGERKYPLFLSITSDGDWANHVLLPLGQSAARARMKTRNYCTGNAEADRKSKCSGDPADPGVITNQSTYYTHSTASIPALYSHYFVKAPKAQASGAVAPQCQPNDTPVGHPFTAGADTYQVCSISGAWNQTPYWIASMPVSIVPDHSDIFHPELYQMLSSFVRDRLQNKVDPPAMQAK